MTKLTVITAKEMERLLFSLGFLKVRQNGSHAFYKHIDGRFTTIPHHNGDLKKALIRSILRSIDISLEDYNHHLNK